MTASSRAVITAVFASFLAACSNPISGSTSPDASNLSLIPVGQGVSPAQHHRRVRPLEYTWSYNLPGPTHELAYVEGPLTLGSDGNFYGTDEAGYGCAASGVFQINRSTSTPSMKSIYNGYSECLDGAGDTGVIQGPSSGPLYGFAQTGGTGSSCGQSAYGCGLVYKLTSSGSRWTYSVLYASFGNTSTAAAIPSGPPLLVNSTLYGLATIGGTHSCGSIVFNCGAIFSLSDTGSSYALRYSFNAANATPMGPLVTDGNGNFFGTVYGGEDCTGSSGCGAVFEYTPTNVATPVRFIYEFTGAANGDGANPENGVTLKSNGDIYGTTYSGGRTACAELYGEAAEGCGTIFKLTPTTSGTYTETTIKKLDGSIRANPTGLYLNSKNQLFGTTYYNGADNDGYIFKVDASDTFSDLYDFTGTPNDGAHSTTTPVYTGSEDIGYLWGGTFYGGSNSCDCGFGYQFNVVSTASKKKPRPIKIIGQ